MQRFDHETTRLAGPDHRLWLQPDPGHGVQRERSQSVRQVRWIGHHGPLRQGPRQIDHKRGIEALSVADRAGKADRRRVRSVLLGTGRGG
jgi:hypothetical protein